MKGDNRCDCHGKEIKKRLYVCYIKNYLTNKQIVVDICKDAWENEKILSKAIARAAKRKTKIQTRMTMKKYENTWGNY